MSNRPRTAGGPGKWAEVTAADPCPICGKPDLCTRTPDGEVACCYRTTYHPVHSFYREGKNAVGRWAVFFLDQPFRSGRRPAHYFAAKGGRQGERRPIERARRHPELPADRYAAALAPLEGASDALAMAAAGLPAVGRPSNTGGIEHLAALLKDWPADRPVVVVGENDLKTSGKSAGMWPGRTGAYTTASELAAALNRVVRWAMVPDGVKDVRDWLTGRAGGGDSRTGWAELGQRLACGLSSAAVQAPPGWLGGPGLSDEPSPCPNLTGVLVEGRAATKAAGTKGYARFRCRAWTCRVCRPWNINWRACWFYKCLAQWCDPLRLPDAVPPVDPGPEPSEAGPWTLYTMVLGIRKWKSVKNRLAKAKRENRLRYEYVRVRVDPARCPLVILEEIPPTKMTNGQRASLPADDCYRVLVALSPGAVPLPELQAVASVDVAVRLLADALAAVPTDADEQNERLRPVSQSKGWKKPDRDDCPTDSQRVALSGLTVAQMNRLIRSLGGSDDYLPFASGSAVERTAWQDATVGGELRSWLMLELSQLRYNTLCFDERPALIRDWAGYLARHAIPCTRDSEARREVARQLPKHPATADLSAIQAAAAVDAALTDPLILSLLFGERGRPTSPA